MRCLLGVDSGGTKCEAVLAGEDGRIFGAGRSDLSGKAGIRHERGFGRAESTVAEAVHQAMQGAPQMEELHVAGGRASHEDFLRQLSGDVRYHRVREQDGPLALAGASAGVVVLAGTGAFAYGKTGDGRELLLDGIGPLYGDHGGAFQIGLAAVRAVGKSDWHPRHETSLRDPILESCRVLAGNPDAFDMVAYMLESHDRSEIASLAQIVNGEAERGDRIARQILENAADDMVETVRCVVDRLGLADEELPLIGTGGVAVHSRTYWRRVGDGVFEFAPSLVPTLPDKPQALGLILAMAAELGLGSAEFRERLLTG